VKPLRVDFAPKRRLPRRPLFALAIAFSLLALQQGWEAMKLQRRLRDVEREVLDLSADIDRATRARLAAAEAKRSEPLYARDARAMAKIAGFPLNRVLASLEATRVQGVKLTTLRVSATDGDVEGELEFTDQESLMHYVDGINAGELKPRWRLMQAQMDSSGTGKGIASIASSHWEASDR
jgi:hypothetical protein